MMYGKYANAALFTTETYGCFYIAAPELIECEKGYGVEIDIWSLGVLLFTALAMSTPFNQGNAT